MKLFIHRSSDVANTVLPVSTRLTDVKIDITLPGKIRLDYIAYVLSVTCLKFDKLSYGIVLP